MILTLPIGLLFLLSINIKIDSSLQLQEEEEEVQYHPVVNPSCDLNYCDSLVNKCKLTNKCNCNWKQDALCSKRCVECLEEKFGKCCGCVG